MTAQEFDVILESRLDKTRNVLASKADEYATGGDRLHNFKAAAQLSGQTPAQCLKGMLLKHWVSVQDMVNRLDKDTPVPLELIDEKLGDCFNYLVLLEAVFREEHAR